MSVILPNRKLAVPGGSPFVYLGRQVVTDALNLDFAWTLDCEAVIFEYRNVKPKATAERFGVLRLSNDGGVTFLAGTSYDFRSVLFVIAQSDAVVNSSPTFLAPIGSNAGGGMNSDANEFADFTVVLTRPFDTTTPTRGFNFGGHDNVSGDATLCRGIGVQRANERNDAIRLLVTDAGGSQVDNIEGEVRGYGILRYPGGVQAAPSYFMPDRLGLPPVWEFIGQKEVSNELSADFGWTAPYDRVMAILHNVAPVSTAGPGMALRMSGDNGSTFYATNYQARGSFWTTGTNTVASTTHCPLSSVGATTGLAASSVARAGMSALVEIHNPSDSSRYTQCTSVGGYKLPPGGVQEVPTGSWGQRAVADVVNGVQFQLQDGASGNMDTGVFTLLGQRRQP